MKQGPFVIVRPYDNLRTSAGQIYQFLTLGTKQAVKWSSRLDANVQRFESVELAQEWMRALPEAGEGITVSESIAQSLSARAYHPAFALGL